MSLRAKEVENVSVGNHCSGMFGLVLSICFAAGATQYINITEEIRNIL